MNGIRYRLALAASAALLLADFCHGSPATLGSASEAFVGADSAIDNRGAAEAALAPYRSPGEPGYLRHRTLPLLMLHRLHES